MIPVSLLLAFLVAFAVDPSESNGPLPDAALAVMETLGGVTTVALLSLGLGYWVTLRLGDGTRSSTGVRSRHALGSRLLALLGLGMYAWTIHWVGWSRVVRGNWGLGGWVLVDDFLILLPYIVIQYFLWSGLYLAETALRARQGSASSPSLGRFLWLRSRQSFGLILPVLIATMVRSEVLERFWPGWDRQPWAEFVEVASMGTLVILAAPLFVRIAWPMHTLPDGPMRQRLERTARRAGFRFTDILVWDTGHTMVNACVSGVLPQFRYVMLTDLLLETLDPNETAAVFGHEVGHIVHRHQLLLALFFLGSLSVLVLAADTLTSLTNLAIESTWFAGWFSQYSLEIAESCLLLIMAGVYVWLVFGSLSRRLERQADVYGTKIISCAADDCAFHRDDDADTTTLEGSGVHVADIDGSSLVRPHTICPVGVRTFTGALSNVAYLNGIDPNRYSWRHGSIAKRIAFLQSLSTGTESDRSFQRLVQSHKSLLALVFVTALLIELIWARGGL